jgi:SecD/SecF fusion protein
MLLIVVYLGFRFGIALGSFVYGLRFGLCAIGAALHDVLVVLALAAITGFFLGWEVSALFITAMLTVIGFSVHDTIVIFDRIRENLRKPNPSEEFGHLVNRSITQSYSRSINTSGTVIATLIVMIAIGTATPDLKFFCAAMLFGILSGTYSSLYNAAPLLYLWENFVARKKGHEFTLMGVAQQEQARARIAPRSVDAPKDQPAEEKKASYSQVRRRASAVTKSQRDIDDDL